MDLAHQLVRDFNVYRMQTEFMHRLIAEKRPRSVWVEPTPERLALMNDLVSWAREHRVEPRLWLYFLFKRRAWKFPVQLKPNHLKSEALIPKFRKLSGIGFFTSRMQERADHEPDPNVDLIAHVEALKASLLADGRSEQCADDQLHRTLGYHPKSRVCSSCPSAAPCAMALEQAVPFSILALRSGRLTVAQARIAAHRSQHDVHVTPAVQADAVTSPAAATERGHHPAAPAESGFPDSPAEGASHGP